MTVIRRWTCPKHGTQEGGIPLIEGKTRCRHAGCEAMLVSVEYVLVPIADHQGAVSALAEANTRIETLLAAENKAWREAQEWKERAIDSGWGQSGSQQSGAQSEPGTAS